MRVLITGATGFVGRHLVESHSDVVVLSRDPEEARESLGYVSAYEWRASEKPPAEAFEGVDVVFHLAGESIFGRWSKKKKERIYDSRVDGTRHLVETLAELSERPKVLVTASAVGYYGDRGEMTLDETSTRGEDFLAEVCDDWETEAQKATELGMRVVNTRFGIILGTRGGALAQMLLPFKLCLGGRLGSGKQIMPWVHIADVIGLLLHAAETEDVQGPLNVVAPNPVSNLKYTKTLGSVLGRPTIFPVPGFILRLLLGEFGSVLLGSQNVVPRKAKETGYEFRHPELEEALRHLLEEDGPDVPETAPEKTDRPEAISGEAA